MAEDTEMTAVLPSPERPPPFTAAERMRRHRERKRKGLRHLSIELREAEIDQFIRRKRLAPEDRANPTALRRTLYEFLDHTLW
jgi:hypothetical protein